MRDVVLYQLVSLDGVSEEPGNWFFDDGPEHLQNIAAVLDGQTDVLLGRNTYDYWASYWPTSDVEPFASFINGTTKHVASSRPLDPPWQNTKIIDGPAETYVRDLKQGAGGAIGIHGSTSLGRSLIAAGLVDEIRLAVAPTVAGSGVKLFPDGGGLSPLRLELVDIERSPQGTLFAHYRLAAD